MRTMIRRWRRGGRPSSRSGPDPQPHAVLCQWEQELRSFGADGLVLPIAFKVGMPVAAVSAIVAAFAVAVSAPRTAEHVGPVGLALLGLAAVPWLMWLAAGDDDRGPTAGFAALT
nr:hypothetical protein [Micromonospora sp. DSM 115978]